MKTKVITFKDLLTKHSYYCSDSNYYSNDAHIKYDNFDDFLSEFKDSDLDYNLCFRFDIHKHDEKDSYYAEIFMMQQRKGKFVPICINEVTEYDTDNIVKWLLPRYNYLNKLWKPFSK
jgi:hypothetical protein